MAEGAYLWPKAAHLYLVNVVLSTPLILPQFLNLRSVDSFRPFVCGPFQGVVLDYDLWTAVFVLPLIYGLRFLCAAFPPFFLLDASPPYFTSIGTLPPSLAPLLCLRLGVWGPSLLRTTAALPPCCFSPLLVAPLFDPTFLDHPPLDFLRSPGLVASTQCARRNNTSL